MPGTLLGEVDVGGTHRHQLRPRVPLVRLGALTHELPQFLEGGDRYGPHELLLAVEVQVEGRR